MNINIVRKITLSSYAFIFICLVICLSLSLCTRSQSVQAITDVEKYMPANCNYFVCNSITCRETCKTKYARVNYRKEDACISECYRVEAECQQNALNNIILEADRACKNFDQNFKTLQNCGYDAWYCCFAKSQACNRTCEKPREGVLPDVMDAVATCREKCSQEFFSCKSELTGRCGDIKKEPQQVDTCKNNVKDEGEDYVDCGGVCAPCNYKVSATPSKVEMFADGKSKQEFVVTATLNGKPIKGMIFDASTRENPQFLESFDSHGRFSPTKLTTDTEGKATITYYAPLANGKRFKNASSQLMVAGASGTRITINLKDPRPWIDINLDKRSMIEGMETNYIDINIKDEDSKKWKINIDASIGKLIPLGENRSGEFYSVVDTIGVPEYHLNWKPPDSVMEVVDGYLNFVKSRKIDANNLWSGIKEESIQHAIEGIGQYGSADTKQTITFGLEAKSYYDQYKTWKGNVEQLQQDINQIKNSSSIYESFVRGLSIGAKGLQTYYGTKKFVEEKLEGGEDNILRKYLLKILDKSIDYGFDSLQSSLRFLADLERESKTDTIKMPVSIVVEVVDEDGNKGRGEAVFQYTYHLLEKDNK